GKSGRNGHDLARPRPELRPAGCATRSRRYSARKSGIRDDSPGSEIGLAPREQKHLQAELDGNAARFALDLQIADRGESAKQLRLALTARRFPFLVQRKRMRLLAHDAVRFQIVAEAVGNRVLEAVVLNRLLQIDAIGAGERHDADRLPDLVGD